MDVEESRIQKMCYIFHGHITITTFDHNHNQIQTFETYDEHCRILQVTTITMLFRFAFDSIICVVIWMHYTNEQDTV